MNFIDYLVIALVALALIWAVRRVILNKKQGKGCSGNCAGCSQNCSSKNPFQ